MDETQNTNPFLRCGCGATWPCAKHPIDGAPALDPNKVQICRVNPVAYDNGQPCACPVATCNLWRGGLRPASAGAPGSTDSERAAWLADKIGGDYAKEAADMLRRWPGMEKVKRGL